MTKRRVALAAEAEADLDDIFRYVAEDSRSAAFRLVDRLETAALDLSESALHYPIIRYRGDVAVRRRVVGTYNILFSIIDDSIEVLHILHGKRNIESALSPESD
jgi:plasmid stabilization system protein ParE